MKITYDRRVSEAFLDLFASDENGAGVASSLVSYARHARFPVDLQFRRDGVTCTIRALLDEIRAGDGAARDSQSR